MENVWNAVINTLKENLSEPNFQIFSNSANFIDWDGTILHLSVNNQYSKSWIKDKCEPIIKAELAQSDFANIVLQYEILEQTPATPQLDLFEYQPASFSKESSQTEINSNFNFDQFVVGNNNRFAHAAAFAVANKPAKAYNPLFIYGNVGIGKTHLCHAIANKIRQDKPHLNVMLVTSEQFTNDLINALKDKRTSAFKERYRGIDVLLIDDIQFLAGKEATQEEFFHTFNELHANDKQIVIASDRPPRDIPTLQERLRTRFGWGLIADIQAPELETRIAILRKKMEHSNFVISDEIIHFLATQVPSNVRELEGALTRVTAYAALLDTEISLSIASQVIQDIVGTKEDRPLTISAIKRQVSDYFSIDYDILCSKQRTKEVAYARQVAMYLARELTNVSLPKIGENFGNRDHSTVMHACDKIKTLIDADSETRHAINALVSSLRSNN
ncbi:MAG: chromosomal replication initiator protein DnaA [bacterium]|nr:chromosomal replication initiator protein DnaA [bacterium]